MNIVTIIGNLTRKPELKYTTAAEPKAICKFSVAVTDGYGDNKKTNFIPVTVFGKQAESCEKYLDKGSKVGVSGKISTGSYEKDGRTVYTTDVIANSVEFLTSKTETPQTPAQTGFIQLANDDIPF